VQPLILVAAHRKIAAEENGQIDIGFLSDAPQ
jgi:hypothetical protein